MGATPKLSRDDLAIIDDDIIIIVEYFNCDRKTYFLRGKLVSGNTSPESITVDLKLPRSLHTVRKFTPRKTSHAKIVDPFSNEGRRQIPDLPDEEESPWTQLKS